MVWCSTCGKLIGRTDIVDGIACCPLCGKVLYEDNFSEEATFVKNSYGQIKVVHICEVTLTKRLIEFENTNSGGMMIEEFKMKAEDLEIKERKMLSIDKEGKAFGITKVLCRHGNGGPPFAHDLCQSCHEEFMKLSGGLEGGSEPPAFQRAEMERMRVKEAELGSSTSPNSSTLPVLEGDKNNLLNSGTQQSIKNISENEALQRAESASTDATLQNEIMRDSSNEKMHAADDATFAESENLSDINDTEVNFYLPNEEEKQLKKIIFDEMNKEYLEEQAAEVAAELAAEKACLQQHSRF